MTGALWTVGHGTLDGPHVARLVADAGIAEVVDVRRHPGSRRDPSVARESLGHALRENGVGYRWDDRLGGRRSRPADSPDTALRNVARTASSTSLTSEPIEDLNSSGSVVPTGSVNSR